MKVMEAEGDRQKPQHRVKWSDPKARHAEEYDV